MKRIETATLIMGAIAVGWAIAAGQLTPQRNSLAAFPQAGPTPGVITIDYPADGSIFPPDMTAPTFIWREANETATSWQIDVAFAGGLPGIRVDAKGERMRLGEIDPLCVGETNQPPRLTPQQAASRTWKPDTQTWSAIKKQSGDGPAIVSIKGIRNSQAVSRGVVAISISKDPVGAPIFYRDVPLMPSELEKGVIKPLAPNAVPLIAWRLRYVHEPRSRLLLTGLHTCANCHSFSRDGKTLGMDLDGPQNDKGLYAIAPVRPQMSIRNQDVVAWSSFRGKLGSQLRVGFMSQISPDGQYVVTTIKPPGTDNQQLYYVANFKDYRFLQVFYPTRGILVWYSRATGHLQPLPGADDPRYVQSNAVWSPDGKYLVFVRALAKEPYPEGVRLAEYANDPNETPIQFDLYRMPFNDGKGGRAEPVAGASQNGMSNSFPKISPDGRWIVFVQARNGLLMRPDGQLYIVPAQGGQARRMRANTPLMNSWHSFSPNGRWLVFSSKSRSPYTQMFLTHLDEDGRDSPAILIENATAANRAVNIPEFLNIPPGGLTGIDVPAAEFYRLYDLATALTEKGQFGAAIPQWNDALKLNPEDPKAHTNLGTALFREGRLDEAIAHFEKALALDPGSAEAHTDLGATLAEKGNVDEAIAQFDKALVINPEYAEAHRNLGAALSRKSMVDEALSHFEKAVALNPASVQAQTDLGALLAEKGAADEAVAHFEKALEINPEYPEAHYDLGLVLFKRGRLADSIAHFEKVLVSAPDFAAARYDLGNALYLQGRIPEALSQWHKALQSDPNNVPVLNQTAWVLATSSAASWRNGSEAVDLAQRALRLSGGQEPRILATLAASYAETSQFSKALETAQRALDLAARQSNDQLAAALNAMIDLYKSNTPYRDKH